MKIRYVSDWDNTSKVDEYKRFLTFRNEMRYILKCFDVVAGSIEFECLSCGCWTHLNLLGEEGSVLPFMKRKKATYFCKECQTAIIEAEKNKKR